MVKRQVKKIVSPTQSSITLNCLLGQETVFRIYSCTLNNNLVYILYSQLRKFCVTSKTVLGAIGRKIFFLKGTLSREKLIGCYTLYSRLLGSCFRPERPEQLIVYLLYYSINSMFDFSHFILPYQPCTVCKFVCGLPSTFIYRVHSQCWNEN